MAEELDTAAIADAVFTADVDDPDYKPPEGDEKKADDKEDDPGDDNDAKSADDKDDKKADEKDDKPDKVSELEAKHQKEIDSLQKEINRLGYALRKDKKDEKKDKETPFTKAQLMQLYKDHSNEPEVVFQIMEEMTRLGKVDATAAAEKSVDIKTKRADMDALLEKMYPDARKEGSELHTGIQKAIEWAHLDGHPFAEHLAFGLLALKSLPDTIKKIKEDAKAEALKTSENDLAKKAEEARKKGIKESKPGSQGKSSDTTKAVTLTPEQMDSAKRLGLTSKAQLARYAKILGVKGSTIHAEA
jgi:hypothetical protein